MTIESNFDISNELWDCFALQYLTPGLRFFIKMAENTFTDKTIGRIRNIQHGDFLEHLSSAYEVLRKIFSYLSLEELDIVSRAFEKWKPIVETTKKERTIIQTFAFTNYDEDCKMWSEANFCITFCFKPEKDLERKLQKHLLENVQFIVVESPVGVIGTPNDCSKIVQKKVLRRSSGSVASVFATHLRLPNFSGVGIETFVWDGTKSFEEFKENFRIPENKVIKCILIFITFESSNEMAIEQKDDFVLFLQRTRSESFAVGGCFVESFLDDQHAGTKYIVFYGDNVEAASIVLKQDVHTKEKIDSEVRDLKAMCPVTKSGVLFVFRCCSRNERLSNSKTRKNVSAWERDALMKYFPHTPTIGCYGYGEIGKKYPEIDCSEPSSKNPRQCNIWEYSFSTSVVYVGFKK